MSALDLSNQKQMSYECALTEAVKNAVFTVSQTKEIIRLDKLYNKCLIDAIEDLRNKIEHVSHVDDIKKIEAEISEIKNLIQTEPSILCQVKKLEEDLDRLLTYVEKDSKVIVSLQKEVHENQVENYKLSEQLKKTNEKVSYEFNIQTKIISDMNKKEKDINDKQSNAIICLREELNFLETKVKSIESKDYKDDRIDQILVKLSDFASKKELLELFSRLVGLEKKKLFDERVDELITRLKALECKDHKDERIEQILKHIAILENRELKDERFESIINVISTVATKKELLKVQNEVELLINKKHQDERVDKVLSMLKEFETIKEAFKTKERIQLLESKKHQDDRVDELICHIKKIELQLERVETQNKLQNNQITSLVQKNIEQENEIQCLNTKLNRSAIILDQKVDNVEKHVLLDGKNDFDQNANIKFLQTEINSLKQEISSITRNLYVKDCGCK
uniref:Uncharacterized protein n=1 Tax=viral metagenome TaxID=1070528 RepID=A0A6C0BEF5_9ZZZZ